MKIKALTLASAVALIGAMGAGVALAQTATQPAKPQTPAAPATSAATPAHKPMHRDATVKPDGAPDHMRGPMHAPSFDDIDTNHDGTISKAEFEAFHAAHPMPPRGGPGEGMRGEGGRGGGVGMEWRFMMMQQMMMHHMRDGRRGHEGHDGHFDLKAADTDHDGKISWAEFQAAANAHLKERFDRLDKNHDGFISDDELHGPRGRWGEHGKDHKDGHDGPPPPPPAEGAAK